MWPLVITGLWEFDVVADFTLMGLVLGLMSGNSLVLANVSAKCRRLVAIGPILY